MVAHTSKLSLKTKGWKNDLACTKTCREIEVTLFWLTDFFLISNCKVFDAQTKKNCPTEFFPWTNSLCKFKYATPHFNGKNLSNNSSLDFELFFHTMNIN